MILQIDESMGLRRSLNRSQWEIGNMKEEYRVESVIAWKQNNIIYHLQFINPTSKKKRNEFYKQSVRNDYGKPTYV